MAAEAVRHAGGAFRKMMEPVLDMVDKADDLETLREALKDGETVRELYGRMDSPELTDILHQALYLSQLAGRSVQ